MIRGLSGGSPGVSGCFCYLLCYGWIGGFDVNGFSGTTLREKLNLVFCGHILVQCLDRMLETHRLKCFEANMSALVNGLEYFTDNDISIGIVCQALGR